MFTKTELNILLSALHQWNGPYREDAVLNKEENYRVEHELKVAESLALRFREILEDYYRMENSHLMIKSSYAWRK